MKSVTVPSAPASRVVHRETLLNVDDDEREDVEVERIDDPSEEHGPERPPLVARDLTVPRPFGCGGVGGNGSGLGQGRHGRGF
jgi:hypothetical protein